MLGESRIIKPAEPAPFEKVKKVKNERKELT
jgi:hypothetical protein